MKEYEENCNIYFSDLTLEDGVVFEIGDEYQNDEEEFSYSSEVPLTNEEALNLLNMDDFEDEDDDNDANKPDTVTLCGISFEKVKSKMTSVFGNGKVNDTLFKIPLCSLLLED